MSNSTPVHYTPSEIFVVLTFVVLASGEEYLSGWKPGRKTGRE